MKKAGVLVPLFSLPNRHGIGDFGKETLEFIDGLSRCKVKIWQILPLNPVGFGYSPYQPFSSYAGDEIFISLDKLKDDGLITESLDDFKKNANKVDYHDVKLNKDKWLRIAYEGFKSSKLTESKDYKEFIKEAFWLKEYALFVAFKLKNDLKSWTEWEDKYRNWDFDSKLDVELQDEVNYVYFLQYYFYKQWLEVKEYANKLDIEVMGDIPFYVGIDSADVWAAKDMFELNDGYPTVIAGVPPDYFSKEGQRWGNPIYNWKTLEQTDYDLWIKRLSWNNKLFDIIRLDHFRAFDTYWAINPKCDTAIDGEWLLGPAHKLLDKIYEKIEGIHLIAEDLGDLRPEVLELRDYYKLKGMDIVQFALNGKKRNIELEQKIRTIAYTGTHDNQTIVGWYSCLNIKDKKKVLRNLSSKKICMGDIAQRVVEYTLSLEAEYAIIPIQDIIGVSDVGRLNTPSTIGSPNWEYRFNSLADIQGRLDWLQNVVSKYHRF